jgi:hypothetical protein
MKIVKGLSIFSIIALLFGSCFKEPEFSIIPQISFEDVYFEITPSDNDADTLTVVINFKDGDGDLGIDQEHPDFLSTPYHENNFFLIKDGKLFPVGALTRDLTQGNTVVQVLSPIIDVPEGITGKLVIDRTRDEPGAQNDTIDALHPNVFPYSCLEYVRDSVFVRERDIDTFDPDTYNVFDTIETQNEKIYVLLETFYYQPNPNYQNIEVGFEVETGGKFIEFNWRKELCGVQPLDQRFFVLGDANHPLEGTLKYNMNTVGFIDLFSGRTMRLRVQIKDRAFHKSNTVYSDEFTLEQITR